jgi:hypothetical protein
MLGLGLGLGLGFRLVSVWKQKKQKNLPKIVSSTFPAAFNQVLRVWIKV